MKASEKKYLAALIAQKTEGPAQTYRDVMRAEPTIEDLRDLLKQAGHWPPPAPAKKGGVR